MADSMQDKLKKAGNTVSEKATEAKNWVEEKAEEASDWVKQKKNQAQNSAEEAEQKAKNRAEENKGDNCGCWRKLAVAVRAGRNPGSFHFRSRIAATHHGTGETPVPSMTPRLLVAALLTSPLCIRSCARRNRSSAPATTSLRSRRMRSSRGSRRRATSAVRPRAGLLDKKTKARDLGFGLHVMDFLLAPGWRDDGYTSRSETARQSAQALRGGTADLHEGEGTQTRDHAR